jgi:RNA polymerase sigma-70 factor (ECF subfamily)
MAIPADQFRRLIETHQRMVFSLALRITGEHSTAEEVAQDVFLALHRSLLQTPDRLNGEDHTRYWLRRVAVHRATDAIRRRAVRPEAAIHSEEWIDDQHSNPACHETPGSAVNLSIDARLEDLLRALPESLRVAIVLRYQEEMAPDEIAQLLNQPIATVKSHLQRGLKLLRRKAAVTMKEYIRESA